eukprot:Gb_05228 [translate_table: standard]
MAADCEAVYESITVVVAAWCYSCVLARTFFTNKEGCFSRNQIGWTMAEDNNILPSQLLNFAFQENETVQLLSYVTLQHYINTAGSNDCEASLTLSKHLLEAAEACEGLSGRALRKLPFLAHAALVNCFTCESSKFIATMVDTARRELSEQTG